MTADSKGEDVKTGLAIVTELIKVAGESPEAKLSAKNLGKSAVILTELVHNALLPLAAVNFGISRAKAYFQNEFQLDLAEKLTAVPPEQLVQPKVAIVGPAMQGLSFSLDEAELKEMYLCLLANSMNNAESNSVHPGYAEVIKQLTSIEADILNGIVNGHPTPLAKIIWKFPGGSFKMIRNHVPYVNRVEEGIAKPFVDSRFSTYVDNWVRLGLATVHYDAWVSSFDYEQFRTRPQYQECCGATRPTEDAVLEITKGMLAFTDFGNEFARVCGLKNAPQMI